MNFWIVQVWFSGERFWPQVVGIFPSPNSADTWIKESKERYPNMYQYNVTLILKPMDIKDYKEWYTDMAEPM